MASLLISLPGFDFSRVQEFKAGFEEIDELNLTQDNIDGIDFDEVGDDLEKFQQDQILAKVLSEV
jgi:hypothetical protein